VSVHAVALAVHIAGGSLAFAAGAAALCLAKGGRAHARAGTLFFAAMLVLLLSGFGLAVAGSRPSVAVGAILTLYLVATARATARRPDGGTGRFERAALAVAIGCMLAQIAFGLLAAASASGRLGGYPAAPHFALAAIAALFAALDLHFIRLGGARLAQRVARHGWRMGIALFGAAGTFLGQQKLIGPSPLMVLPLAAILGTTIYWLVRLRRTGSYRRAPTPAAA
jgi:hypothetical protein